MANTNRDRYYQNNFFKKFVDLLLWLVVEFGWYPILCTGDVILQNISRQQLKASGLNPVDLLYIMIGVCDGFHSVCKR
jgi:hypothetical protein